MVQCPDLAFADCSLKHREAHPLADRTVLKTPAIEASQISLKFEEINKNGAALLKKHQPWLHFQACLFMKNNIAPNSTWHRYGIFSTTRFAARNLWSLQLCYRRHLALSDPSQRLLQFICYLLFAASSNQQVTPRSMPEARPKNETQRTKYEATWPQHLSQSLLRFSILS